LAILAAIAAALGFRRAEDRLDALHPAVQTFYDDAGRWRSRRLVRIVLPSMAGGIVVLYLIVIVVGRLVERLAPALEPAVPLGALVLVAYGMRRLARVAAVRK